MLTRLYNLLFIAGVFCLIMAGAAFMSPPTSTSARPLFALTPTAPPPPTPEPTDPPPTATTGPVNQPTATPPPTATTGPVNQPTATPPPTATTVPTDPPPATATPQPRRKSDPEPEPTAMPELPTATPAPAPNVEIGMQKTVDHDIRAPGQAAVYTLIGRNDGPAMAYDVVISDDVPDSVEVIDLASSKGDVVLRGQSVTAYPSVLAPGESVTVTISVRVRANAAPGAIVNTGTITTSTKDDPGNNSSSAMFTIPALSLTVQKLPRTSEIELSGLFSLPIWLPWLLVGGLLTMLGSLLRLRGCRAVEQQPAPAASAALSSRSAIFRLPQPTPAGPPRLGPELPPPAPPAPLPPLTALNREDALSDAIESGGEG